MCRPGDENISHRFRPRNNIHHSPKFPRSIYSKGENMFLFVSNARLSLPCCAVGRCTDARKSRCARGQRHYKSAGPPPGAKRRKCIRIRPLGTQASKPRFPPPCNLAKINRGKSACRTAVNKSDVNTWCDSGPWPCPRRYSLSRDPATGLAFKKSARKKKKKKAMPRVFERVAAICLNLRVPVGLPSSYAERDNARRALNTM